MRKISKNNFIYSRTSFNTKKEEKNSMENILQNGINNLAKRAEREVPEYGDFAPVVEKFEKYDTDLKIGSPSMKIVYANDKKDKTLKRLELDVPSASGKSSSNIAMELGNKQEILNALFSEKLVERIKNNIQNAAKAMVDKDFA